MIFLHVFNKFLRYSYICKHLDLFKWPWPLSKTVPSGLIGGEGASWSLNLDLWCPTDILTQWNLWNCNHDLLHECSHWSCDNIKPDRYMHCVWWTWMWNLLYLKYALNQFSLPQHINLHCWAVVLVMKVGMNGVKL